MIAKEIYMQKQTLFRALLSATLLSQVGCGGSDRFEVTEPTKVTIVGEEILVRPYTGINVWGNPKLEHLYCWGSGFNSCGTEDAYLARVEKDIKKAKLKP